MFPPYFLVFPHKLFSSFSFPTFFSPYTLFSFFSFVHSSPTSLSPHKASSLSLRTAASSHRSAVSTAVPTDMISLSNASVATTSPPSISSGIVHPFFLIFFFWNIVHGFCLVAKKVEEMNSLDLGFFSFYALFGYLGFFFSVCLGTEKALEKKRNFILVWISMCFIGFLGNEKEVFLQVLCAKLSK